MNQRVLKVQQEDNIIVALDDLKKGEKIEYNGQIITLREDVSSKHKFTESDLKTGEEIFMYGVLVGKAQYDIPAGSMISTFNVKHAAAPFKLGERKTDWTPPDISKFSSRTFKGYHRSDGSVGTANYWIVLPLVFCENRNLEVMKNALVTQLGYGKNDHYQSFASNLINEYKAGKSADSILENSMQSVAKNPQSPRIFANVDGVKFLNHDMGCGGTRQDAQSLCGLLAGYIAHPNVAGATVLSLGCQNAQYSILQEELEKRNGTNKPVIFLEQQAIGTEEKLIEEAIKQTFVGLIEANKYERKEAPLSKLKLGLGVWRFRWIFRNFG